MLPEHVSYLSLLTERHAPLWTHVWSSACKHWCPAHVYDSHTLGSVLRPEPLRLPPFLQVRAVSADGGGSSRRTVMRAGHRWRPSGS